MILPVKSSAGGSPVKSETFPDCVRHRRLSKDEVQRLAARIAAGDREARNDLVQANLGLVWRVARQYVGRGLGLEDLVGEGNLGLIRAAEAFNPHVGTRFSTYATYWIKQSILAALMNTTPTIRVPAHAFRLLTKWTRVERELGRAYGRAPSCDEVVTELGLSDQQKGLVLKARYARGVRPESALSGGQRPWATAKLPDEHEPPEAQVEADDEWNYVLRRLEHLDRRARMVLILRYGLGGEQPSNYLEIARRLSISREWVRKLEKYAIRCLSQSPDAKLGPIDTSRSRRRDPVSAAHGCGSIASTRNNGCLARCG